MIRTLREAVIVAGSVAQRPHHGGHAWVFLQYLLGFRRLGFDVLFVDRLDPGMDADESNVAFLAALMERFGLADSWAVLLDGGRDIAGRPRSEVVEMARRSVLLLNVMGYLDDDEILAAAPLRAFLDIDPGFGQMWHELGLADLFGGHDRHVTVGQGIGGRRCSIPTCGIDWITTLPPVELSEWPRGAQHDGRFTSVVSWRGPFGPVDYDGRRYGLRVHEFRRFLELPARTGEPFEVALDIDDGDRADAESLERHGWMLADPRAVAGDPWRYRDYVRRSAAELMIAKNLYVDTRSGWFSDRSACYLASCRPALVQDTGLEGFLPLGEGLLAFSDPAEATAAVKEVRADYDRHSRAARAIAEEHFAAQRVLRRLLEELGVR
jgi:hypothetical protein